MSLVSREGRRRLTCEEGERRGRGGNEKAEAGEEGGGEGGEGGRLRTAGGRRKRRSVIHVLAASVPNLKLVNVPMVWSELNTMANKLLSIVQARHQPSDERQTHAQRAEGKALSTPDQ